MGRPKHTKVMVGAVEGDQFIGNRAEEFKGIHFSTLCFYSPLTHYIGLLKLQHPMEHGVVTNWNDMEHIWTHLYSELKIQAEEHPVLLTEAPINPRKNREKAAEIFFETFNISTSFPSLSFLILFVSLIHTTCPRCSSPCKQFCRCMLQEGPQASCWTQGMVSLTLCLYTRGLLCRMPS